MSWVGLLVAAASGLLVWTFLEYLVHGILSHRFRTFVTPLHGSHHKEPRAVFTSVAAWGPLAALIMVASTFALGRIHGLCFGLGVLAGFLHYEWFHWRIHFREPRTPRERLLRAHHLAHHFRDGRNYHGVTTRFWDRVFGTLSEDRATDYAAVASIPPLPGPSNFGMAWNPLAFLREAAGQLRSRRHSRRHPRRR